MVSEPDFVAARFPYAVLNNALLWNLAALPRLREVYAGEPSYAVWTEVHDAPAAAALADAGFRREVTTLPMVCRLDKPVDEPLQSWSTVSSDAAPAQIAALNGVPPALLEGVPGLRCYATIDGRSGLVAQDLDDAVVVSFVATVPAARGQGLASMLTRRVLLDARSRAAAVAVLQATPMAERIYQRLGFVPVGQWQEWVPA